MSTTFDDKVSKSEHKKNRSTKEWPGAA